MKLNSFESEVIKIFAKENKKIVINNCEFDSGIFNDLNNIKIINGADGEDI